MVTLHLTLHYSTHDTIVDTAEITYTWHGNTYTTSGQYDYIGQTVEGCDSIVTLMLTITQPEGIHSADQTLLFKTYPNPTTGMVTIEGLPIHRVEVYDNAGRMVKELTFSSPAETTQFDLTDLPSGAYVLRMAYGQGTAVCRLIIRNSKY